MNDILKYLWFSVAMFSIFALIVSLPYSKYQKSFNSYLLKQKNSPQAKINAAQKYLNAYENGEISEVYQFGYSPEFIKYYNEELNASVVAPDCVKKTQDLKYSRPLYIRDKNNPNILYPYSENFDY